MAIGHDAAVKLQEEGIQDVNYLEMVDKNFLKTLTDTIKRSGGQSNVGGVTVVTPAFKFNVKVSDDI